MPRPVASTLYGPTGPIYRAYRQTGPAGWLREGRYGVNLYAYALPN